MSSKHDKETHHKKHKTDHEMETELSSVNTASITNSGNSKNHIHVDAHSHSKVHSSAEAEAEQEQKQKLDF